MTVDNRNKINPDRILDAGHYIVIAMSFILTFVAWQLFKEQTQEKTRMRFEQDSEKLISHVQERMQKYEDALWAGVARIKSSGKPINFNKWTKYVEQLNIIEKYPGINGIGVIYKVKPNQASKHIAKIRSEGQTEFNIHPKHGRDVLFPITYLTPIKGNKEAIGLDMSHEDNRYNAIIQAGLTHEAQITGPITLVQDAKKTPGFLFYAPFYSSNAEGGSQFEGVVYAPFIVDKLLDGILSESKRTVSLRIKDGSTSIYNELTSQSQKEELPALFLQKKVELYGRTWYFATRPNASFTSHFEQSQPMYVLLMGLLIDTLIILLFIAVQNSKRRAVSYAEYLNSELVDSNKKIERANKTLRSILNNAKNIIIIQTDEFGRILFANDFIESVIRRPASLTLGAEFLEVLPLLGLDNVKVEKFETMVDCLRSVNQFYIRNSGDSRTFLSMAHTKICKKHSIEYIFVISNTTSDVEKEQLKNEFIAVLNHELRTPLTSINGSLYLIDEYLESNPSKSKELVSTAKNNCEILIKLINDMLDITKMDSGTLEITTADVNLSDLVRVAIDQCKAYDKGNTLNWTIDIPEHAHIVTDAPKMTRVISNILSNAMKFSNSLIDIELVDSHYGEAYTLSIKDDGIGISKEFQTHLFEKFSQENSKSNRDNQGTGLGLYIAQKVITELGGTITVDSVLNQGATFSIQIPKYDNQVRQQKVS